MQGVEVGIDTGLEVGLVTGLEANADGCCCCCLLLQLLIAMMTLGAVTTRWQVLQHSTREQAFHVWHAVSMNPQTT